MVEPSRLAETVTPSRFWPEAERIAPLSTGSAAQAAQASEEKMSAARSRFISIPFLFRHGPDVGDHRVDLVGLQVMLEGGHAAAAVDDEGAHQVVIAGGGGLVKRRAVGLGAARGLEMADAARLREDLLP